MQSWRKSKSRRGACSALAFGRDLFENASKKSAYRPSFLTAAISRSKSCINALGGSLAVSKLQLQLQLAAVQPCLMLTIPTRYLLPPRRSWLKRHVEDVRLTNRPTNLNLLQFAYHLPEVDNVGRITISRFFRSVYSVKGRGFILRLETHDPFYATIGLFHQSPAAASSFSNRRPLISHFISLVFASLHLYIHLSRWIMKFRSFSKATRLEVLFHYLYVMISPSAINFELECQCLQSGKAKITLIR
jgi:hypothetical protein